MTTPQEVPSSVEASQPVDPTPPELDISKSPAEAAKEVTSKDAETAAIATDPAPVETSTPEDAATQKNLEVQATTEEASVPEETSEIKDLPVEKISLEDTPPSTESKETEADVEPRTVTESPVEDPVTVESPEEQPVVIDPVEAVKPVEPETVEAKSLPGAETAPSQLETPISSE